MANPFAHIELNTDDVTKAKKFYKGLFGWKLNDMKGPMPYTMIDVGKGTGGGMTKKMANGPTSWLPYVEVESVKKTLAKAAKSGGQVVLDHMEIGANGAIGIFVDPTGAALGVWEAAKKAPKKKAAKAKAKAKKGKR